MPRCSKSDVVLVRYPFSDLSSSKVRPAAVVNAAHESQDLMIVPLTSRTGGLLTGEFVLAKWAAAGLNVRSAVKRGLFTIHARLVVKALGRLSRRDTERLEVSLRSWLGLEPPAGHRPPKSPPSTG